MTEFACDTCRLPATSWVDAIRRNDDESTDFITVPLCDAHRKALGEFVAHFEPIEQRP